MATAEELQAQLPQIYRFNGAAEALFFKTVGGSPSFRFETSLGWEFSRGLWVGPDPKGTFYYREGFFGGDSPTLPRDRETEAHFLTAQVRDRNREIYAHIKFFAPGSTTELLGEFLARDQHNVTGSSGLLNTLTTGKWKHASSANANAIVSKNRNSREINISCPGLGKAVKILCNQGDTIYGEAINYVDGRLTVRSIREVNRGTSIRWYHDLVVFHDGPNAQDFSAFFFPNEDSPRDPLGSSHDEKRWTGAVWNDT